MYCILQHCTNPFIWAWGITSYFTIWFDINFTGTWLISAWIYVSLIFWRVFWWDCCYNGVCDEGSVQFNFYSGSIIIYVNFTIFKGLYLFKSSYKDLCLVLGICWITLELISPCYIYISSTASSLRELYRLMYTKWDTYCTMCYTYYCRIWNILCWYCSYSYYTCSV